MTELKRYKTALEKLAKLGNGDCYGNSEGNMIAYDALFPQPETEAVEITQYTVITPNGGCLGTYPTQLAARGVYHESYQLVPLTGTYQRTKAHPVERSVELWFDKGGGYEVRGLMDFNFHGKRGNFTWEE